MPDRRGYSGIYWSNIQQRRLLAQRCQDCDQRFLYGRICCPACGSERVVWFESAGQGTIYSYTIVHQHRHPAYQSEVPYVIALADLTDLSPGSRLMARVEGCDPCDVRIGMRVGVAFNFLQDDFLVPVLIPASEAM